MAATWKIYRQEVDSSSTSSERVRNSINGSKYVPNRPKTPYNSSKSTISANGTFITSYSTLKSVEWAKEWCLIILWYHPRCKLHSWPHIVTLCATIATNLSENCWKHVLTILTFITYFFTHKSLLWVKKWCLIILWYHPRYVLHLWLQIVALWATISITTHLLAKMAKNGSKQVFDDTYVHNLLFYTQVCSMDQKRVFNYYMVSP
jgi:hypothetical protein